LQGTDAYIFSGRATVSERRNLEPRWRHAVGGRGVFEPDGGEFSATELISALKYAAEIVLNKRITTPD
jgi:hypothetical protein